MVSEPASSLRASNMLQKLCVVVLMVSWSSSAMASERKKSCYPAVFVFGDSRFDVGQVASAFPFTQVAEFPPYGETYWGRPSNRYTNGRILSDFITQAFNLPFLSAFMQGLHSDYRHGISFGSNAANARPVVYNDLPFNLQVQVAQYKKSKILAAAAKTSGGVQSSLAPDAEAFANGLHIVSIGENDYRSGYLTNMSYNYVKQMIPIVVGNITFALEELYAAGARKFLVSNLPVEGCKPFLLELVTASSPDDYDEFGCLKPINEVTQLHNAALKEAVLILRAKYPSALFIYADDYEFNLHLIKNHDKLGFNVTTRACCGAGPSKYNFGARCGSARATVCDDPFQYLSWDGIHPTEHFYHLQALMYLAGEFIEPPTALADGCSLNLNGLSLTHGLEDALE